MKQSRSHFTKNMIFSHHVLMKKLHLMPAKKLHEQLKTEKLVNEWSLDVVESNDNFIPCFVICLL